MSNYLYLLYTQDQEQSLQRGYILTLTNYIPWSIHMNPFKAVGNTITSLANTIVALSTLAERTVQLASNEVDALEAAQQIRLDEVKYEREQLKEQRLAKRTQMDTDKE